MNSVMKYFVVFSILVNSISSYGQENFKSKEKDFNAFAKVAVKQVKEDGNYYAINRLFEIDFKKAVNFLEKTAPKDGFILKCIAYEYQKKKDSEKAKIFYKRAAEAGHYKSYMTLANLYGENLEIKDNKELAKKYLLLASKFGQYPYHFSGSRRFDDNFRLKCLKLSLDSKFSKDIQKNAVRGCMIQIYKKQYRKNKSPEKFNKVVELYNFLIKDNKEALLYLAEFYAENKKLELAALTLGKCREKKYANPTAFEYFSEVYRRYRIPIKYPSSSFDWLKFMSNNGVFGATIKMFNIKPQLTLDSLLKNYSEKNKDSALVISYCYFKMKDETKFKKWMEKAIAVDSSYKKLLSEKYDERNPNDYIKLQKNFRKASRWAANIRTVKEQAPNFMFEFCKQLYYKGDRNTFKVITHLNIDNAKKTNFFEELIKKNNDNKTKFKIIWAFNADRQYAKAIKLAEEIIVNTKDNEVKSKAQNIIGQAWYCQGKNQKAIIQFKNAIKNTKDIKKQKSIYHQLLNCFMRLQFSYAYKSEEEKIKKFELQNTSILKKLLAKFFDEKELRIRTTTYLAKMYAFHKDYKNALIMHQKLYNDKDYNKQDKSYLLGSIGEIYFNLKNYNNAIKYYKLASLKKYKDKFYPKIVEVYLASEDKVGLEKFMNELKKQIASGDSKVLKFYLYTVTYFHIKKIPQVKFLSNDWYQIYIKGTSKNVLS